MEYCHNCGTPWKDHGTACPPKKMPFKCPVCSGRKKIPAREDGLLNIDAAGIMHDYWIGCPACDATGIVWG